MAHVFLEGREELLELDLVELNAGLAERVDQVTDASSHDLSALAPVQSLLFNLAHQRLYLLKNF